MARVYLDWNATTPLRLEARAAMASAWEVIGNPSSIHAEGRAARALVEGARGAIASAVGAQISHVVFTSGGTEANGLALTPSLRRENGPPVERLIVSAIEHPSVLAGGRFPKEKIAVVPVTPSGLVDLDALRATIQEGPPALVSIMLANNETGAIQPVAEAADSIHQAGGLLHVDAVQGLGKIDFNINSIKADLVTISAHKLGGPKGVGALVLAEGVVGLETRGQGGGQEQGRRAGTENVPGIAGFGAAVAASMKSMVADSERLAGLRTQLERQLRDVPGTVIFANEVARLPNTALFAAPGISAETALIAFDLAGIAVSSGSACSSGKVQPSHVLAAMGVAPGLARGAIRLSMGWDTTPRDIECCLEAWRKLSGVLGKGK